MEKWTYEQASNVLMNTTLSIAFIAGLISFFSPCVLPLIPGYISYISGTTLDKINKQQNTVQKIPYSSRGDRADRAL